MRCVVSVFLLCVAVTGLTRAQPAAPPPLAPPPAPATAPRPAEPGAEAVRSGAQGGERAWRRETTQQAFPAVFMERLRQEQPDLHERLTRLYREDRQQFLQEIRTVMRERGVQFPEGAGFRGHRDSPEEQKCAELSRRYLEAKDDAEKERIKAELAAAIKAAFEVRVRTSKERVARLEKQLQEFRQNLERLEANRDAICAERLEDLTQPADLRWDGKW